MSFRSLQRSEGGEAATLNGPGWRRDTKKRDDQAR